MVSRQLYSPMPRNDMTTRTTRTMTPSSALSSGRNVLVEFYLIAKLKCEMYVPPMQTTSRAMSHHPMSIIVTSLHIGVVSPTSDEIGDVASTSLGLIP